MPTTRSNLTTTQDQNGSNAQLVHAISGELVGTTQVVPHGGSVELATGWSTAPYYDSEGNLRSASSGRVITPGVPQPKTCSVTTKMGARCKGKTVLGTDLCMVHGPGGPHDVNAG